jgi:ABC-type transport system substrate-binding protein
MLVAGNIATSAKTAHAGVTTLRLGFLENNPQWAPTLDPAVATDQNSIWLLNLMYQGLVGLKMSHGKVVVYPQLASTWHISKDG